MSFDRIQGLLYGAALGDALGAPHELRSHTAVYTGKLEHRNVHFNRFQQSTKSCEVGQVTDDTEMMLVLAKSLATDKCYNKKNVIMDYLAWSNSKNNVFRGLATRKILANKTYAGYLKSYERRDPDNQSNGALMRCAILGLLPTLKEALEDCSITNDHEVCVKTNRSYLSMIRCALRGGNKNAVLKAGISDHEIVSRVYENSLNGKIMPEVSSPFKGWCLCAYSLAVYAFNKNWTFAEAFAFLASLKGDMDTNMCVTGALMGAFFGFKELYAQQSDNIQTLMRCTTEGGDLPRPLDYRTTQIPKLAKKLAVVFFPHTYKYNEDILTYLDIKYPPCQESLPDEDGIYVGKVTLGESDCNVILNESGDIQERKESKTQEVSFYMRIENNTVHIITQRSQTQGSFSKTMELFNAQNARLFGACYSHLFIRRALLFWKEC